MAEAVQHTKNIFCSWMDIHISARKDHKAIRGYVNQKNSKPVKDTADKVDLAIAREIERDMKEKVAKTWELTKNEYSSLSAEDIRLAGLTDRQREVVELRQQYSYKEVADKLGIEPITVYLTYTTAIDKIRKYKDKLSKDIPPNLTKQQIPIYQLYSQGLKPAQISKQLGISNSTVWKQLSLIRKTLPKQ